MDDMNEPPRLWKDTQATPALRAALHAGRQDHASARRLATIAAGLGAAGVPVAHAAAASGMALGVKIAIAVVAVSGIGGAGIYWRSVAAEQQQPQVVHVEHKEPAPVFMPKTQAPATEPEAVVKVAPAVVVKHEKAPKAKVTEQPKVDDSPLAESLWLENIRKELSANPKAALERLATYKTRFASPILDQEASVLKVEALVANKQLELARREGQQFVKAHPDSPHRRRLERLLNDSP
jgi:hypothetical protein